MSQDPLFEELEQKTHIFFMYADTVNSCLSLFTEKSTASFQLNCLIQLKSDAFFGSADKILYVLLYHLCSW